MPEPMPASSAASTSRPIVVGISGGSGMAYAIDTLHSLRHHAVSSHLVVSNGAKQVIASELEQNLKDIELLADEVHQDRNLGASIASGSFLTRGMVVVPCSAGTLAKIAHGFTDTLLTRAAHVTLKERRPLILVVREAPYPRAMLQNMLSAHDAGAIIVPASPGFYQRPETVADMVASITARVLDLLGVDNSYAPRWS